MVIHLETKIVSLFGVLDSEGNVVARYQVGPEANPTQPDPLNIQVFNQESFVKAFEAITTVKKQLEEKVDADTKPVV
jgi:hypothetical protein